MRAIRSAVAGVLLGAVALGAAAPALAQYSKAYEFLTAVRERDGAAVTDALNEPGSQMANTRDLDSGDTALHIVVEGRDAAWTRFLLLRGVNPNIANKKGETPLQLAARIGFTEAVGDLVKHGARLDVGDSTGETALMSAVHRRDLATMRVLLEAGADPDRSDNSGRTARDYAGLQPASTGALATIEDKARAQAGATQVYGPSF